MSFLITSNGMGTAPFQILTLVFVESIQSSLSLRLDVQISKGLVAVEVELFLAFKSFLDELFIILIARIFLPTPFHLMFNY